MTTTEFRSLTEEVASSLGAGTLRIVEVPHPLGGTDPDTVRSWADAAADAAMDLFAGDA
ncbi:MAG: hypothetical protein AAF480_15750 [Actinomycetota bacterium]